MDGKFSRATRRYAAITAACLCLTAGVTARGESSGISQRLSKLEQAHFGAVHRDQPLDERLQALELNTLGRKQTGAAASRLQALERKPVSAAKTNASTMPPVAPPIARSSWAAGAGKEASPSESPFAAFNTAPQGMNSSAGTGALLRGSATEYGATKSNVSPAMNPLTAPLTPGYQPNYGGVQGATLEAAGQQTQLSGNASQHGLRPHLNPAVSSAVVGGTLSAVSRLAPGGAGTALKYLHCPLCRLLAH